jgi:DNA (cytosine-5)-methyltransferase 3A
MKILSLFDGVSCARLALEANEIKVDKYYASEIDKYAVKVTQTNRPDTIQIGDVKEVENVWGSMGMKPDIDLLIGGSPCQDLSIAKKDRKGLKGDRSSLFYEYVRILNEIKPKYFVLENVASMPKEAKQTITEELFGIEPVMINASLVSAQNRKRLFWVGKWNGKKYEQVIIPQPEDRGILLKDILESNVDEKFYVTLSNKYDKTKLEKGSVGYNPYSGTLLHNKARALNTGCGSATTKNATTIRVGSIGQGGQGDRIYSQKGKSVSLSANGGGRGAKTGLYKIEQQVRKLTPVECERLQSMPDNWTNPTGDISNTQRYKMCGNAFNVQVVAHILKNIL